MARLALLQCELEHRHQAPHLAMALFARDLTEQGHSLLCALVHPSAIQECIAEIAGRFDLLLLDSIFPFGMIQELKEGTGLPALVGGHNALQHALRGPADAALIGPARRTLSAATEALLSAQNREHVPGLWFWTEGQLRCGPPAPSPQPLEEVVPFEPVVDWHYFGPPRAPGSNLRLPSIVADSGCLYNRSAWDRSASFYQDTRARTPGQDLNLSDSARRRLHKETVEREGGCSFCAFRYTQHQRPPAPATLDSLVHQAEHWLGLGARELSLQTEHPLPLVGPLLEALATRGNTKGLDSLQVRSIPWLLLREEDLLIQAINVAEGLEVQLVLAQVGFEAFDEGSLSAYNKGISAQENERCAALLGNLSASRGKSFCGTAGHGLIPFQPWSTVEGLRQTLDACKRSAPFLLSGFHPGRRVELYQEWGPLFWKLQDDALLTKSTGGFGWTWRYANPEIAELSQATLSLCKRHPAWAATPWRATEAALEVAESVTDPKKRVEAYEALAQRGPHP